MSPTALNCRAMARSWFRRRGSSRIPRRFLRRAGKVGVIWPNNRDVDDLVPYLDRLAAVALVFPSFRDGRAYSQARLLRERHGFDGELRATGQVLRDQFVFMLRAGFDAFEVKKDSDAEAFAATARTLFGVLPADRRRPRHRAASADAAASFGERRPVNARAHQALTAKAADISPAQALDRVLRTASPAEIIEAALKTVGRERLALVSSFGTESAALLKVMADVDPGDSRGLPRHRLAVRGDAGLSRYADRSARPARCPLDQAARRNAVARGSGARIVVLRSRCLLPHPQGRAAGAGAEAVRGMDQRPQALPGRRCARNSPSSRTMARS